MEREEFRNLLQKYLQGTSTEHEKSIIDEWYASIGKDVQLASSKQGDDDLEERYWKLINDHIQKDKKEVILQKPGRIFSMTMLRAVAVIVAAMVVFFYFELRTRSSSDMVMSSKKDVPYMKYVNNYNEKSLEVTLPDNSKIFLENKASVYYLSSFNSSKREVYLQGKAFFEVTHDSKRPFLVYSNEVMTLVHGTSFTITAIPEEKNITVSVKTGVVSVFVPRKNSNLISNQVETILTPNQQIIYNRSENICLKSLIKAPQPIISPDEIKRIQFSETPVTEIFRVLEKMYGVEIDCSEAIFNKCLLTTSVSEGDLFDRIDIICKAIGASYTVDQTKIIIHGNGCN